MPSRMTLDDRERAIIGRLKHVLNMPVTKIALAVGRNKTTVYKALRKSPRQQVRRGRPELLSKADVDKLVRVLRALVAKANARMEVTLAMVRKASRCKASERCIRTALHKRGIRFRAMRSKPLLTEEDIRARYAFARAFRGKSRAWWQTHVHMHMDLKNFPVYTNAQSRALAAQREIRGAYRKLGQGLDRAYVVSPKALKVNTGARSCRIAAGVGAGRVILWHEVGRSWSGSVAADLYRGPVLHTLQKTWPGKRSFRILEDNDPTGFKSRRGIDAKAEAGINVFEIPKRSPDLNVLDYAVWKQVGRIMRKQERSFPKGKRETREEFVARLRRVAVRLPRGFVEKAVGDMARRCERLYMAKGGHFEEGGR